MSAAPNIRSVPQSSEARLRELFADEDRLLGELAKVRARQRLTRTQYSQDHGLLLHPSMETLRKVLCG